MPFVDVHPDVHVDVRPYVRVHIHPHMIADGGSYSSSSPDPHYLDNLQAAGLRNLSADEVIELRSMDIDGAYIRELSEAGYSGLSVRELDGAKVDERR